MKKILLALIIITSVNAEITHTQIHDAIGEGVKNISKSVYDASKSIFRRATNTRTEEEICISRETELRKREAKNWWDLWRENTAMIKILIKHKINYNVLVKRYREKKINLSELKRKSCSEKYFNYLLQSTKAKNKIENKNKILKKLINANGLSKYTKSIYERTKTKEENKYQNISETIIAKKNLKEQMQRAIKDMN
jgi:hypothetical protein